MHHPVAVKPVIVAHGWLFRVGTDACEYARQIEWQGAFHFQVVAARRCLLLDGREVALVPATSRLSIPLRQPIAKPQAPPLLQCWAQAETGRLRSSPPDSRSPRHASCSPQATGSSPRLHNSCTKGWGWVEDSHEFQPKGVYTCERGRHTRGSAAREGALWRCAVTVRERQRETSHHSSAAMTAPTTPPTATVQAGMPWLPDLEMRSPSASCTCDRLG